MLSKVKRKSGLPWLADSEKTSELEGRLYQGLGFKPCVEQKGYGENDQKHTIFYMLGEKNNTQLGLQFCFLFLCSIFAPFSIYSPTCLFEKVN